MATTSGRQTVLRLDGRPERLSEWLGGLWHHRDVLGALARKDFKVRYKRASLGALWAVLMPVLQATVMVFVFSRIGRFTDLGFDYAGFVLAGVVAWFYVSTCVPAATTSIVDASSLTDKVWFPRAILTLVPALSNLVTLAVSVVTLLVALPIIGAGISSEIVLLVPGLALLLLFTASLGLLLGALDVYFRDVKFLVQAGTIMWFYLTPIVYPASTLGDAGRWLDFNPLTGIVGLLQRAAVDAPVPSTRAIVVSVATSLVLAVLAVAVHRRHDRLFVDLL